MGSHPQEIVLVPFRYMKKKEAIDANLQYQITSQKSIVKHSNKLPAIIVNRKRKNDDKKLKRK